MNCGIGIVFNQDMQFGACWQTIRWKCSSLRRRVEKVACQKRGHSDAKAISPNISSNSGVPLAKRGTPRLPNNMRKTRYMSSRIWNTTFIISTGGGGAEALD